MLFQSKDHIEKFRCYLYCQSPNIKFTSEIEENISISFLHIKIRRVNNTFSTNNYRKITIKGVFMNFESFIPVSYKSNLIFTLSFRAFRLCSNFELFHHEILNLKNIFKRNGYPCNFIDVCIKRFLNYVFIDKMIYALAPKNELVWVLSFIGKKSLQLGSKLVKSVQNNLSFCHLQVVFQSPYKLHTLVRFKDSLNKKICSHLDYRYSCSSSNGTYYGKTYQHIFTRAAQHMGISNLTGTRVKSVKESEVSDNL